MEIKIQKDGIAHRSLCQRARIALQSLNAEYGVGSVGAINLGLDGVGYFQQSPYGARLRWRRFRILEKNNKLTVFALRRQKTVD